MIGCIVDTLDFVRLQIGHLTFIDDDRNIHSLFWDAYKTSGTRSEQLEDWAIPHFASVLKDGAATLRNHAARTPGISLDHSWPIMHNV